MSFPNASTTSSTRSRTGRVTRDAATGTGRRPHRVRGRLLRLRARAPGAQRRELRYRARANGRTRRPHGSWEDHYRESHTSFFYDATRRPVRVDGRDVREVSRWSLRAKIAAGLQEPFLFSGTIIAESIAYGQAGKPERGATREEIEMPPAPPRPTASSPSCPKGTTRSSARAVVPRARASAS